MQKEDTTVKQQIINQKGIQKMSLPQPTLRRDEVNSSETNDVDGIAMGEDREFEEGEEEGQVIERVHGRGQPSTTSSTMHGSQHQEEKYHSLSDHHRSSSRPHQQRYRGVNDERRVSPHGRREDYHKRYPEFEGHFLQREDRNERESDLRKGSPPSPKRYRRDYSPRPLDHRDYKNYQGDHYPRHDFKFREDGRRDSRNAERSVHEGRRFHDRDSYSREPSPRPSRRRHIEVNDNRRFESGRKEGKGRDERGQDWYSPSPPRRRRSSSSRSPLPRHKLSGSTSPRRNELNFIQSSKGNATSMEETDVDGEEMDEEAKMMAAMMGIHGFNTTKGKKTQGDVFVAQINKPRQYRQYMNKRVGAGKP